MAHPDKSFDSQLEKQIAPFVKVDDKGTDESHVGYIDSVVNKELKPKFNPQFAKAQKRFRGAVDVVNYSEDQPRDDHGRWTDSGSGEGGPKPSSVPSPTSADLHEISRRIRASGGFTYSPVTHSFPAVGFSVSTFKNAEQVIPGHHITGNMIKQYMQDHRKELSSDPRVHLGGWLNTKEDKFYLDLSVILKDRAEALRLGRKHDQLAIYDLKNGVTIDVPKARHKGAVKMSDEVVRDNVRDNANAEIPEWVRVDFPPDATPDDIAAAIQELRKQYGLA